MSNRPGRKTHSDRLLRTKRKARSVPGVQRKKRSTPTARPVPSERRTNVKLQPPNWCPRGEGPTSNFNRRTGPRTKDQCQLRRFGPRCLRRTNVKLRIDSIPSWETLRSTRATGITHPGFYGWKPWKKPNNAPIITAPTTQREGFRHPFRRLPPKCSQKFTTNPAHSRPVYRHRPRVRTRLAHRRSSCCFSALRVS